MVLEFRSVTTLEQVLLRWSPRRILPSLPPMTARTALLLLVANATSLVANAATLAPASVPATGRQEVLLTLDAPAALHLSARSANGTSCELTDRVRGPFAQAGTPGGANCELDLLLDAGQYKVRLESPRRGKGNVALSATPFTEVNATRAPHQRYGLRDNARRANRSLAQRRGATPRPSSASRGRQCW